MKRYGDTKTNLVFTDKALKVYSGTDPMNIFEHDNGTYSVDSCIFSGDGLTAEEVNQILEEFDDLISEQN